MQLLLIISTIFIHLIITISSEYSYSRILAEENTLSNTQKNHNYQYREIWEKNEGEQYDDLDSDELSIFQYSYDTNDTADSLEIENMKNYNRISVLEIGYKIWKYLSDVSHTPVCETSTGRENNVSFLLYTLKNPQEEQEIFPDFSLEATNWDKNENVKIIIHGYKESGKDQPSQSIKNAYMEANRPENIVIVDWKSLSKERNYFNAAKNTKIVGELVAEFIIDMEQQGYIKSLKQVHVIGFSLGAQTAGITGYFIQRKSGGRKLARITALDPAGPGFEESVDEKDRIDKSDADFVDVIHCDQGKMTEGGYRGTELICGHADFYPNGGSVQPGCDSQSFISKIFSSSCSHMYCPKLFQQSILGRVYVGCQCPDWQTFLTGSCDCGGEGPYMGEFCSAKAQGEFYLKATVLHNGENPT